MPARLLILGAQKGHAFFQKRKFDFTMVHGCMYGLKAESGKNKGMPIKKPWKLLTPLGLAN